MHELGMTERILAVALERARGAGGGRITDVHLELGDESDVAPTSIELYWGLVSAGTAADGARLHFAPASDPAAFRLVAIDVDEETPPGGPWRARPEEA